MLCIKFLLKRPPCYALNFHLKIRPPILSIKFVLQISKDPILCAKYLPQNIILKVNSLRKKAAMLCVR